MGGKHKLVGQTAVNSIKLMKDVTDVFDQNGIKYCLEGGTLLGVIRENRLLPWDDDLDFTCVESELPNLRKCYWKLFFKGLRIRERKQFESDAPLKKGMVKIVKIYSRKYWFFKGDVVLDIFIKYKQNDQYFWSVGKNKRYTKKSVDSHYYEDLATVNFEGKEFSVPKDSHGYLTKRYGDWQKQVKEWDYATDDQSVCKNPEE